VVILFFILGGIVLCRSWVGREKNESFGAKEGSSRLRISARGGRDKPET
jgi:hypothetical protein